MEGSFSNPLLISSLSLAGPGSPGPARSTQGGHPTGLSQCLILPGSLSFLFLKLTEKILVYTGRKLGCRGQGGWDAEAEECRVGSGLWSSGLGAGSIWAGPRRAVDGAPDRVLQEFGENEGSSG